MQIGEKFNYSTNALQLSWNADETFIKELLSCNIKEEDDFVDSEDSQDEEHEEDQEDEEDEEDEDE